jgi:uncharacterized protein (TIGR02444 family)
MSNAVELPASPFWDFTLAIYQKPGVSPSCIALQDRHGLDVNFLLMCLFAGTRGRTLGEAEFARLEAAAAPWRQNVIHPLRAVRRWLKEQQLVAKEQSDPLRRGILAREIDSEGLQQRLMETQIALAAGKPDAPVSCANLIRYLRWARVTPGDADLADLAILASQSTGNADLEATKSLLRTAMSQLRA